jgi:NADPH2:quinone reductase
VRANRILLKNIGVIGLHWGPHVSKEPAKVAETFERLFELYREEKIRPVIFKTYALEDLPVALAELATRKTYGKLIVTP